MSLPRISIVTSSYNQGRFIGATIESVLAQGYPNLEHIVVDGMSTDETPEVLARYPHLKVIREPDRGQADAINKGFRIATGEIFSFLNSDDLLLPGALHRVAAEIRPSEGRHVVMGRCRFIDEEGHYTGIEHPSHFESFARVLEVWKGHFIPQPAVFFTAEVWRRCGPLRESLVLDYDLFCRVARYYKFHFIDQPLAAYRLHGESKTVRSSDAERLEQCVRVSRQYWGSKFRPLYWRMTFSWLRYRFNRQGRASRWLTRAADHWWRGRKLRSLALAFPASLLAPEVALNVALVPALRLAMPRLAASMRILSRKPARASVQTRAFLDRTTPWDDGWLGPRCVFQRRTVSESRALVIQGAVKMEYLQPPLVLTVFLNGKQVHTLTLFQSGHFYSEIPLSAPLAPGVHWVEIRASQWWVPHHVNRSGDYRPLSWRWFGEESVQFR